MGRSPCCDKVGLKKGPWTPEEDQKLLAYIEEHGHGSWRALPTKAGLQRCGKSCRLRWTNYLRPDIKRGKFSLQEEQTIIQLHALLGNRWSAIATHLPKRTDNEIKNYWNTHVKKRLTKMGIDPVSHKPKNDTLLSGDGQSKSTANLSHMAQWESARLEAEARLVKQSKLRSGDGNAGSSQQNQRRLNSAELSPASTPVCKPVVIQAAAPQAPRCLDILKAWNGVWGSKPVETAGGEIQSPTSTLSTTGVGESSTNFIEFQGNSSGSCDGGTPADEGEEDWKSFGSTSRLPDEMGSTSAPFPSGFHELTMSTTVDNAWMTAGSSSENVSGGKFLESFTDLLLSSTSGSNGCRNNYSEGGGDSDIGLSCGGSGGGDSGGYYWNNIFNLVNSSPSDSPMF